VCDAYPVQAEALYMKGEFEYALMYFHRGHKMRPELSEFSRGISKSTEAIENSVSHHTVVTLPPSSSSSAAPPRNTLPRFTCM
jgi:hypothetical protein